MTMAGLFEQKDLCLFLVEVGAIASVYAYSQICEKWELEEAQQNDPVNYYGVTRRFTSAQSAILENYFQSGISQPTEEEASTILEKVGRHGEYGLLISKNMIFVWFKQRCGLPKEVLYDFEEPQQKETPDRENIVQ